MNMRFMFQIALERSLQLTSKRSALLGAGLLLLLSTAAPQLSRAAADETVLVSILGMTCEGCVVKATKALEELDSVDSVEINLEDGATVLKVASGFDRDELRSVITAVNLELLFQDETPAAHMSEAELAKLDIKVITHGKKVKLEDHLAEGKFTIFDFMADWCKPCKILSPKLEQMVKDNDDVALRMVDIVDWKSDMAKHSTKKYKLSGIPYVRVYGPDGNFLGAVTGLQLEEIASLIEEARS